MCTILDNFILKCWGSSIALGCRHSCAILDDTRLKCWGSNQFGQLGDSTTTTRTIPTEVDLGDDRHVISIALGYSHTCAILDNKTLKCWGGNGNNRGQLGDPTRVDSLTPTVINVGDSRYAVSIALGVSYTCAIVDNICWGSNDIVQLGDCTAIDRTTPSTVTLLNNKLPI